MMNTRRGSFEKHQTVPERWAYCLRKPSEHELCGWLIGGQTLTCVVSTPKLYAHEYRDELRFYWKILKAITCSRRTSSCVYVLPYCKKSTLNEVDA